MASHISVASTWRARMIGLLGHHTLEDGEALFLPGCRSIHTWGMHFAIDALFVNHAWCVVAMRKGLRPWRIVSPVWRAWGVVELRAGALEGAGVQVGDQCYLLLKSAVKSNA